MEQNKVNLSLIYAIFIFAIGVGIKSITNFAGGIGVPFVAVLVLTVLLINSGFINKANRSRLYDIFVLVGVGLIFALILFCSFEWANEKSFALIDFFNVFANIYSVISLISLIYCFVRYISEINGFKIPFVEIMLGNGSKTPKEKKEKQARQLKEVMNGDLEQKPSSEAQTQMVEKEEIKPEVVEEKTETVEQTENVIQNPTTETEITQEETNSTNY